MYRTNVRSVERFLYFQIDGDMFEIPPTKSVDGSYMAYSRLSINNPPTPSLGFERLASVNHNSHADTEVVLGPLAQSHRIVIYLNSPDIKSVARANIQAPSECCGEKCVRPNMFSWTVNKSSARLLCESEASALITDTR